MKNLIFVKIPLLITLVVLVLLALYIIKEVIRQSSSIKIMIIGIAIILLAIAINMFIITKVVAILGVLVVIYGAKKID